MGVVCCIVVVYGVDGGSLSCRLQSSFLLFASRVCIPLVDVLPFLCWFVVASMILTFHSFVCTDHTAVLEQWWRCPNGPLQPRPRLSMGTCLVDVVEGKLLVDCFLFT